MKNNPSSEIKENLDAPQKLILENFPYKTFLSFEKIIAHWEKLAAEKNSIEADFAVKVLEKLGSFPHLKKPHSDLSFDESTNSFLKTLMLPIYPPAEVETSLKVSLFPFQMKPFYYTPKFKLVTGFDQADHGIKMHVNEKKSLVGKTLGAITLILYQIYNIDINLKMPFVIEVEDDKSKLSKYIRLDWDSSFLKVKTVGNIPKISEDDVKHCLKNISDFRGWLKLLPPENFEIHGFTTTTGLDITEQEVVSLLKYDLLEKESIVSPDRFQSIQKKIQSYFQLPNLKLGLAVFPQDCNLALEYGRKLGNSLILNSGCSLTSTSFNNSIYDEAINSKKTVVIENLMDSNFNTDIEKELIRQGIKSVITAPLYDEENLVGMLELGSVKANELTSVQVIKLKAIISLFATAVSRSLSELENTIQAVIKEKCTAIHPCVEWRFRRAALNLINKTDEEKIAEMEPLVFENVFPLYGLSDIRDSSLTRNESIQSDLIEHLRMANDILIAANRIKELPYLNELIFRVENNIEEIKKGVGSGDEVGVLEFIKFEIESIFDTIKDFGKNIKEMITNYFNSLDPELKVFYQKRKDFEDSISLINDTIATYLEEAEVEAQKTFPHYFEKYKTDGIEHGIYIGQSLVENKKYNELFLKNLRLWQLIAVSEIARKTAKIKEQMKIPLDTTHLILVQNTPLSIRFRQDEKKFDVDGTYNIRYEIMKKRIDKAYVKGMKERLTQPHKIAIVYSQPKEAFEYRKYIEYLQSKGVLQMGVEELELESLQGVQGLRALRVTVNIANESEKPVNGNAISQAISQLSGSAT
jgi:GAF domain-containing protein